MESRYGDGGPVEMHQYLDRLDCHNNEVEVRDFGCPFLELPKPAIFKYRSLTGPYISKLFHHVFMRVHNYLESSAPFAETALFLLGRFDFDYNNHWAFQ